MVAASSDVHGRRAVVNFSIVFLIHRCSGVRYGVGYGASIMGPSVSGAASTDPAPTRDDSRRACEHVELESRNSSKAGHLSFSNANGTAYIDIQDDGVHAWNIQTPTAGNHSVKLPVVHIVWVSVNCVHKGLCKNMVTKAINHWRFEEKGLESSADFGVSLLFAANPAIAGCICYMDAMMLGNSRKQLYVRTKSDVELSTHEGFVTYGDDMKVDDEFQGASLTIDQATRLCLTMIPGCQGFSMKRGRPEDPETKFPIEELNFKDKMGTQDLVSTKDPWTSYRVQGSSSRPYKLQYEPRDGRLWYREWCKQTFLQESTSPLQDRSWLFL